MKPIKKKKLPPVVIDVGNRINEIIILKKIKLRHVTHDANLDVENLRKYIKGRQEMKISTMLRIVKALDIKVSDLFNENKDIT